MKKEENRNVAFSKGGTGSITYKVNLPTKWVEDMGIIETDREVLLKYDDEEKIIKIRKK